MCAWNFCHNRPDEAKDVLKAIWVSTRCRKHITALCLCARRLVYVVFLRWALSTSHSLSVIVSDSRAGFICDFDGKTGAMSDERAATAGGEAQRCRPQSLFLFPADHRKVFGDKLHEEWRLEKGKWVWLEDSGWKVLGGRKITTPVRVFLRWATEGHCALAVRAPNGLPAEIQHATSVTAFKSLLKTFFKKNKKQL